AQTSDWSDPVQQHFAQAKQSAAEGNFQQAALALTFMENLLKQHANYQDSLEQLGASSAAAIGTPLREPLRTVLPPVEAAPADMQLTFDLQAYANDRSPCDMVWASSLSSSTAPALWTIADNTLRGEDAVSLPFPGDSQVGRSSLLAVDLNFDFRQDLVTVGEQGCMIYVNQGDGSFQSHDTGLTEFSAPWRTVWAWDLDADGDLDLLLSDHRDKIQAIQNNGDLTLTPLEQFVDAEAVRDMAAADLDGDGDLDLCTLSVRGEVFVWQNERGGQFVATATPPWEPAQMAIAVGDIDRDGTFEIITWSATGHLRSASLRHDGTWRISQIVTHRLLDEPARGISLTTLAVADIDNNGAVDILASTRGNCWIWLNTGNAQWQRLPDTPLLQVVSVADMNGDGLLDLVGLAGNDVRVASGVGRRQYGWCDIHTTSNPDVGDKRINPFGIGGRIEVRAGTLAQAATISSPTTFFGLGHHERADVARIVWPNGTVQAEFDLASRATTAAKQRLKGSCPWVFTYDGTEF
ncbi:MAG: CRTAC1 family protein, partial [Planctomycetales bacterium]|nr:CRTAC1 family protein [Planctomycetales bacterium]